MSDLEQLQARLRGFAAERDWEQFHTPKNLAMALSGEAGELLAEFQWLTPEESLEVMTQAAKADAVEDELADVMIYLTRLADILDVDLMTAAHAKIDRNEDRFPSSRAGVPATLSIRGTAIAGEDRRQQGWRRAVAEAATGQPACTAIAIDFVLEPGRRVDIDNLARVVLAGLRDAGVCRRGFRGLDDIVVTKSDVGTPGVSITLDPVLAPTTESSALDVSVDALPGGAGLEMGTWEAAVDDAVTNHVTDAAWVDVSVRTARSLVDLMKPIIDGLTPVLGRDPRAQYPFSPNDHLVERLSMRRVDEGHVLHVRAGGLD